MFVFNPRVLRQCETEDHGVPGSTPGGPIFSSFLSAIILSNKRLDLIFINHVKIKCKLGIGHLLSNFDASFFRGHALFYKGGIEQFVLTFHYAA